MEDIFNLGASTVVSEFYEHSQVGFVYDSYSRCDWASDL